MLHILISFLFYFSNTAAREIKKEREAEKQKESDREIQRKRKINESNSRFVFLRDRQKEFVREK